MISNNYKTSLLIPKQLPEFVRDDLNYETFVTFIKAYYEWLELAKSANSQITTASSSGQGVTYAAKNLLEYSDVDTSLDDFIQYFLNDFLPYIPADALADKRKLVKISKEFYKSKGSSNSYEFLFRALYNSAADTFNTSDVVLRASDGKWIIPKSVRVDTTDLNWLKIKNLRLFGETTKSYATIDNAILNSGKIEVFISSIQRLFNSGEFVRVVDNNNKDVYFYNDTIYFQNTDTPIPTGAYTLRQKIVGVVASISVGTDRGLFYNSGDPVVITGGLNPEIDNPIGASAVVGATTVGSLSGVSVVDGSAGYRLSPNANVIFTSTSGSGANASVTLMDETKLTIVSLITANTLGNVANQQIGNSTNPIVYTGRFAVATNTNSTLRNSLTFLSFNTFPIAGITLNLPGTGYTTTPSVEARSLYQTSNGSATGSSSLASLGMLQPIRILNGGVGYSNANTISIVGGMGIGAFANIVVNTAGSIISANYVYSSGNTIQNYPLGGLGYERTDLPRVIINSTTGTNASLIVPGILGDGASLTTISDRLGEIISITVTNQGEDYVSSPTVSLKVADITLSNVSSTYFPESGDQLYQGSSFVSSSFKTNIDTITKITTAVPANTLADIYLLRTYEYFGTFNESLPLKIDKTVEGVTTTISLQPQPTFTVLGSPSSIKRYGDGTAKANANFLNGLIIGQGQYLNDDGHISSLGIVLESEDYNNYTYVLSVEKALRDYKDLVLNLLHPAGMKLIGRNLLRSSNLFNMLSTTIYQPGFPLSSVAGPAAFATLEVNTSAGQLSNNIIKISNILTGNIGNTIIANDIIEFTSTNNVKAYSIITRVDHVNNLIFMAANVFLTFPNIAFGTANASSNIINITTLTGQYDGEFSPKTPVSSMIYVGDSVSLNGTGPFYTVTNVFANGNISVANSTFGPVGNSRITLNKNANTQSVMIYGEVQYYDFPQLTTELGQSLLTEDGDFILIG